MVAISGELQLPLESDGAAGARLDTAADGHVNTLVDLYRHHQQRIYRYCLALLRNPDDAEDATQETFTRAAPFLPNLPGDLSAYLTTVARNICCDVVRARARRAVPIDTVPLADRKVSPERQSIDWDVVRRMWRQLSPSERLLFAYTFAGYKYEEIASRTGMSRPSVSVGLARARRRLRDLAAATGTLGLLPLGIRRLLDRAGRRVSNAMSSTQAVVVGMVDQVGAIAAGLLSGLFVLSATAPAAVPSMLAIAAHPAPADAHAAAGAPAAFALASSAPVAAGGIVQKSSGNTPSPRPPASSGLPVLPAGVASDVPGATAVPQDTTVRAMAASPGYPTDHIVFVSGPATTGCPLGPTCSALFRSADAGASWSRLAYLTTEGADSLLLPPTYPADPVLFSILPGVSLEELTDGTSSPGDTGTVIWTVPGVYAAAIAPDSTRGHEKVVAAVNAGLQQGATLQQYVAGDNTPAPGAVLPAGFNPGSIVFTSPDTVVVAGSMPAPNLSLSVLAATVCPLSGQCGPPFQFSDAGGQNIHVVVSPNVATDHVVTVLTDYGIYVSTNGGQSFREVLKSPSVSVGYDTVSLGQGPTGPRILVSSSGGASRPTVLKSDDLGASFSDITGNLDNPGGLVGSAAYPDGTILAAVQGDAQYQFALRQTTGNGTWINPS